MFITRNKTIVLFSFQLKTALPLTTNRNLGKIDLPKDDKDTFAGKTAVITGFGFNKIDVVKDPLTGKKEEVNGLTYGKMRYAEAKVITTAACQRYYANSLSKSHICASLVQRKSTEPEGVCSVSVNATGLLFLRFLFSHQFLMNYSQQGDSGGPLVYGNILIGIVSTSPLGCREDKIPAIYTRVSSYVNLLRKAIDDVDDDAIRTKTVSSSIWG